MINWTRATLPVLRDAGVLMGRNDASLLIAQICPQLDGKYALKLNMARDTWTPMERFAPDLPSIEVAKVVAEVMLA